MKTSFILIFMLVLIAGMACKSSKKAEVVAPKAEASATKSTTTTTTTTTKGDRMTENQDNSSSAFGAASAMPRRVIIYKTKQNYAKNVPIGLDETKTKIISYPSPRDIVGQEPLELTQGFWLDKRGIRPNSAFLIYDYDQYANLKEVPSLDELFQKILDPDPIIEMYECGPWANYGDDIVGTLKKMITDNQEDLGKVFKKIK